MSDGASSVYSPAEALRRGGKAAVRAALLDAHARTGAWADAYARALGPALAVPCEEGLNPPLWELGHVAWFRQWWIGRNPERARGTAADPDAARLPGPPGADALFDSSRVPHRSRWSLPLPALPAARQWLDDSLRATLDLLDALPPAAGEDALYVFRLAALHEAMHAEAAAYMARRLGFEVPLEPRSRAPVPAAGTLCVPAQALVLGSPGPGFAFDNEQPAQRVRLQAFEIDAAPVSWSRIGAFLEAGGYADARWWTPDGWAWRLRHRPARPVFPADASPAVHLSAHEADAWCRWAGRRLPFEVEWEMASQVAGRRGFRWGDVHEWTASTLGPFPGFAPAAWTRHTDLEAAPRFGRTRVVRGASFATRARLKDPKLRGFALAECDQTFIGFRSCAR